MNLYSVAMRGKLLNVAIKALPDSDFEAGFRIIWLPKMSDPESGYRVFKKIFLSMKIEKNGNLETLKFSLNINH